MTASLTSRLLGSDEHWAGLLLRLPAGVIFVAHGGQKLFGLWGGYGLEGTGQYMASLGLEPGYWMALLAGGIEFFGGLALLLGLLVRPAALLLSVTMLIAIVTAHWASGLLLSNGGYEFALSLLAMSLSVLLLGGGRLALDNQLLRALGRRS